MEKFVSEARKYISTKESEALVVMHEEMMTELREHTRLLKHLVKLEKLDIQTPTETTSENLKLNIQKSAESVKPVPSRKK